jgi:hypothetical protein
VRRTLSWPASRSRPSHPSPSTSARRSPVVATSCHSAASRSSRVDSRKPVSESRRGRRTSTRTGGRSWCRHLEDDGVVGGRPIWWGRCGRRRDRVRRQAISGAVRVAQRARSTRRRRGAHAAPHRAAPSATSAGCSTRPRVPIRRRRRCRADRTRCSGRTSRVSQSAPISRHRCAKSSHAPHRVTVKPHIASTRKRRRAAIDCLRRALSQAPDCT